MTIGRAGSWFLVTPWLPELSESPIASAIAAWHEQGYGGWLGAGGGPRQKAAVSATLASWPLGLM